MSVTACTRIGASAFTAFVVFLQAADAWARAGAGDDFGDTSVGGGDSFGGGIGDGFDPGGESSGDGLAVFLRWLFKLCVHRPLIGIPVLIVLLLLIAYGLKVARSAQVTKAIRRGRRLQRTDDIAHNIHTLLSRDAAFQQESFLDRASAAFLKIQAAWCAQDLKSVRSFVSDGIHERFALYFEMQKADGVRSQMEDVQIHCAEIAAVESDERFETIHVMFEASAADSEVDLDSGRPVKEPSIGSFVEYWSFHRRTGTGTLTRAGSLEGFCPNCAAPLDVVDSAKCSACGSTVNSGEHDWVLAEITQESEWKVPNPEQRPPGVVELQKADPGFSVQHVEDRASVMFWRLIAAEYFDDAGYVAPILAANASADQKGSILARTTQRQFWRQPAVGRVELLDVETSASDGMDRARVLVRWSGILCSRTPRGRVEVLRERTIYSNLYVLARRTGVKSLTERAFASSACLKCGAPIAVSKDANCPFCGTMLADGALDWVLESIEAFSSDMLFGKRTTNLPSAVNPMKSPERIDGMLGRELSLAVLVRMMRADGQVSEQERELLMRVGQQRRLSPAQVDTVINTAGSKDAELPVPRDSREAISFLEQLVQAGLADGKITHPEQKLLFLCSERFGYSRADLRLVIARERQKEYELARNVLSNRRQNGELSEPSLTP